MMDYKLIDNIELGGIDLGDYPDFCDAYIQSAYYGGEPMSEKQLESINENRDFVHECVWSHLF